MVWFDHDETTRKALLIWTFFRSCGYESEYLFHLAEKHPLGAQVSITVKKPGLPTFHIIAGRVPYSPAAARKRWGKMGYEALQNNGNGLVEDCRTAFLEPATARFFAETLARMEAIGLPSSPAEQPQGGVS